MTQIENISDIKEAKRAVKYLTGLDIIKTKRGKYEHRTGLDTRDYYNLFDKTGWVGSYYKHTKEVFLA